MNAQTVCYENFILSTQLICFIVLKVGHRISHTFFDLLKNKRIMHWHGSILQVFRAQLAAAVEYTDCIPAERLDAPTPNIK